MPDDTKKCPVCAEVIKAEAKLCRFCGATFEVARRGYCSTDHAMMDADENGRCKTCGNEVMDIRLETRLLAEGGKAAAAASVPAPAGDVTEWVIEPIRGEGVNWRFNGVFLDWILIDFIYSVSTIAILGLSSALFSGRFSMDDLGSLYAGTVLLLLPVIWFLYFFLFETISGATPGKQGSFLKVIRKDGGKIAWWQAAIRAFFSFFEYNIIGAIFIWSTPLKQRIGDLIAGTLVINREKLYKVEFRPEMTALEFHDYRRFEFARVTEGVIRKFGLVRDITLNGVSPQGESVTLKWHGQFQRGEVERVRREIERRQGIAFSEKIILWRLITVIVTLGLGFLLIAALVIGVANQ